MKGRDGFQMSPELIESVIEGMGDGISIQDTSFKVLYQNEIHKGFVGEHIGEYCYKGYEKREKIFFYCLIFCQSYVSSILSISCCNLAIFSGSAVSTNSYIFFLFLIS